MDFVPTSCARFSARARALQVMYTAHYQGSAYVQTPKT
jgi:ATP-dependent Clp protease adapter protein ClpS